MKQEDFEPFASMWLDTAALYGATEPSTRVVQMIFNSMAAYDLETVRAAINTHVTTNRFMPVPADIIDIIKKHQGTDTMTVAVSAEMAARMFLDNLDKRLGAGDDVVTLDTTAVAAFHCVYGTLAAYCSMSFQDEPFRKKDFIETYQVITPPAPSVPENHLLSGIYHDRTDLKINVRPLDGYECCKPIIKELYEGRNISLKLQPDDPLNDQRRLPAPEKAEQKPMSADEFDKALAQLKNFKTSGKTKYSGMGDLLEKVLDKARTKVNPEPDAS